MFQLPVCPALASLQALGIRCLLARGLKAQHSQKTSELIDFQQNNTQTPKDFLESNAFSSLLVGTLFEVWINETTLTNRKYVPVQALDDL
ncbi:hypothetical protein CEXT_181801 [Caerostris extrusa]|uniref:Uncharacterized protein n=1 Tax=Caerostris extrusa TaxID=172846 RepID=A0AAV4UUL5_CAEEX|nr:hypothetical protein CEXT_181801 [Caerostris extrusa]